LRVIGWGFALADDRPFSREICIELQEFHLVGGQFVVRNNGVDGTFRDAQGTVNALFWVDDQEVQSLMEAFDRADFHAVGIFTLDTAFNDNKGHDKSQEVEATGGYDWLLNSIPEGVVRRWMLIT